jgi:hypothetical protein
MEMASLRDRFHDVDVIEAPDVWEQAQVREPAPLAPHDRTPRGRQLTTIAVASVIAVLAIVLVVRAFPTGTGRTAGSAFAVPGNPCDLLTVAEIERASGGHVTGVRQLTSSDYPLLPTPGAALPCEFMTDSRFGDIIVATDPNGTTNFDTVNTEDPLNVPIVGLGDEAFAGDKNSVWVRIGDGYFSITAQRGTNHVVAMLTELARTALASSNVDLPSPLASGNSPTPYDKGRIAYAGGHYSGGVILTMAPDGSDRTELTSGFDHAGSASHPFPAYEPAWSPDGKQIAFRGFWGRGEVSDIFVMDADGSNVRRLTTGGADQPAWSPDGTQIAYASTDAIYAMNVDGSNVHPITPLTHGGEWHNNPTWSPDGSAIAYTMAVDGHTQIFSYSFGDSRERQLINVPNGAIDPSWSPDGSTIAFSLINDQKLDEVYLMNADGSARRPVTTCDQKDCSAFDPAWAPDGSRIVFGTSSGAVDSVNADGLDLTVLVDDGKSGEPAWQPTG